MNFLPWNFPFSKLISQEGSWHGQRHVFLDLEDTIITPVLGGWSSVELLNRDAVRDWLDVIKPTTVNLFSFAITDQGDLDYFDDICREWLERNLQVKFTLTPTMDDITGWLKKAKHLSILSMADIVEFWGKGDAFNLCAPVLADMLGLNVRSDPQELILLDDSVTDCAHMLPGGLSTRVLNLETLLDCNGSAGVQWGKDFVCGTPN